MDTEHRWRLITALSRYVPVSQDIHDAVRHRLRAVLGAVVI
jgi:hypothetical protein